MPSFDTSHRTRRRRSSTPRPRSAPEEISRGPRWETAMLVEWSTTRSGPLDVGRVDGATTRQCSASAASPTLGCMFEPERDLLLGKNSSRRSPLRSGRRLSDCFRRSRLRIDKFTGTVEQAFKLHWSFLLCDLDLQRSEGNLSCLLQRTPRGPPVQRT